MAEQTCAERIRDYYKSRMTGEESIGEYLKALESDDHSVREEASDRLYEMPLSVEVIRTVKILLGTGGPGDWFEAQVDSDGSIGRIEYHFNDWFDHAAINVSDDDDARTFCDQFVEAALVTA